MEQAALSDHIEKGGTSRKRGETRESLLNAGLRLFGEKGFEGTSVKDIEAAVGLTPGSGSFYRHFKSKECLMEEIVSREIEKVRGWRELRHQFDDAEGGDRREALLMNFNISLNGMNEIKDLINLLGREYGQGRFPELLDQVRSLLLDEGVEFSSAEYAKDIKQGLIKNQDPQVLASILVSALVGYHLANMFFDTAPGGVEKGRFVEGLVDLIMKEKDV